MIVKAIVTLVSFLILSALILMYLSWGAGSPNLIEFY
jgi:hypothetical protein